MVPFLLSLLASAQAPAPPDRDWAEALRADAQFMHDNIAANHPGPYNKLDPGFSERNDAGLARALERARSVTGYPGYYYALKAYAASFDDGHLGFGLKRDAPPLTAHWPGFLTGFEGGRQIVKTRADDAPLPLGAELESCDGVAADTLAATNVGAFEGRWFLASRRRLRGGQLFVDQGNPFIARPTRCRFVVDGTVREVVLDWRPIDGEALTARVRDTNQMTREPIGVRRFADGTRWFTLSGFDGDPASSDAKALTPLIAAMHADRDAIAAAPRIVLDLRGNNGGSSDWSAQIAEILWGKQRLEVLPSTTSVEWRASAGNVETIRELAATMLAAPTASDAVKRWFETTLAGISAAHDRGEPFWREPDEEEQPRTPGAPPAPPAGTVYFVTDSGCASACLDAADLWLALGAIQVGQETSADTLYMDVRQDDLPSGLAAMAVPMKVYGGRARASNEPLRPTYAYPGNLRDTDALEAWIAALPANR